MFKPDISNAVPGDTSQSRFTPLAPLSLIFLSAAFITRLVLFIKTLPMLHPGAGLLLKIFGIGFFYDCVTFSYAAATVAFFLIAVPEGIYRSRGFFLVHLLLLFCAVIVIVLSGFSEYV